MDLTKKSVEVLKKLQLKNGGITATLPNGGYPYVYARDGVIITKAFNRVGESARSKRFFYFMKKFARVAHFKEVFQRYNADGLPSVTRMHQHDNTGLLIHGIHDTFIHSKDEKFLLDMWELIEECVKAIFRYSKNGIVRTEHSIHESSELESGHEIWAHCACCRGMFDAAEIAFALKNGKDGKKWMRKAKELERSLHTKFFDKKRQVFKKNLKFPKVIDSTQLAPFYFGIVKNDKALRSTLSRMKEEIWYPEIGGFRRFKKQDVCKDWHWYSGGSGAWLVFTLWAARFYKELGDKAGHDECMKFIERTAERSKGLFPEHVSTAGEYALWKMNETEFNSRITMEMKLAEKMNKVFRKKYGDDVYYWATPLGWSHAEYVLLMK
jgi:GH15 family glucan-1,4-alpha-glucosidase